MTRQVEVTPADIQAAAEQAPKNYQTIHDYEMALRQAFARHRLAALESSGVRELVEGLRKAAAVLADDSVSHRQWREALDTARTLVSQNGGGRDAIPTE